MPKLFKNDQYFYLLHIWSC